MHPVNITAPEFTYDAVDPPGFQAGMFRFGPLVGAAKLGASVYELPPGEALCPTTTSTPRRSGCSSWRGRRRCARRRASPS